MELTYDQKKFIKYFVEEIYLTEIYYFIDIEKEINQKFDIYSESKVTKQINYYSEKIELTEKGYLLKEKFNELIKENSLSKTVHIILEDFTSDFTLDTINQILNEYNLHQFIEIKERIYERTPFEFHELFSFLHRPVEYHYELIKDLEKIITIYCLKQFIENRKSGLDIKIIMDNFQAENDFRLFPYYHYNHKPIKEQNQDYIKNKYPEVFTDDKAYNIFLNIVEEFDTSKNVLVNYSYIFHYLKNKNYIISSCPQKLYFLTLNDFNIKINRIKPEKEIGNKHIKKSQLEIIISNFK